MEIFSKKVPIDFNYFLFGDDHEGSVFRNNEGWLQLIDHMRSKIDGMPAKSNFGLDHGDICDCIDPKDKRYSSTTEKGLILEQMEQAKKNRIAIREQIVLILQGNHDLVKQHLGAISKTICNQLGVQYGSWSAKVKFYNRKNYIFSHFATHGRKTIRSIADDPKRRRTNKLLSLKRSLRDKPAGDCILNSRGHTHWCDRMKPANEIYFTADGQDVLPAIIAADHTAEYIPPDLRWYVSTGSFLKAYKVGSNLTGYAESADYDPQRNGYQLAKIRSGKITEIEPVWVE